MKRSNPTSPAYAGIHVGIIMDGNGRWAAARGLPRTSGHRAGLRTARRIVEEATRAGVGTLTLYAFSADNWSRPTPEVSALMRLFRRERIFGEWRRCCVRLFAKKLGHGNRAEAELAGRLEEMAPSNELQFFEIRIHIC